MERFWNKVNKTDTCWLWTAGKDKDGYGKFRLNGKHVRAHRVSYEMHKGLITPILLVVCHTCDNPSCVNPDHLWLGTPKENTWDMINKKRRLLNGIHNVAAKLNEKQVKEIRHRYKTESIPQIELAKEYGVNQTSISNIIRKQTWNK